MLTSFYMGALQNHVSEAMTHRPTYSHVVGVVHAQPRTREGRALGVHEQLLRGREGNRAIGQSDNRTITWAAGY